jgi:hypothetical protein
MSEHFSESKGMPLDSIPSLLHHKLSRPPHPSSETDNSGGKSYRPRAVLSFQMHHNRMSIPVSILSPPQMGGFHQTLPRDSALGGLDLWQ